MVFFLPSFREHVSTAIAIKNWMKFAVAVAKVFTHHEAWVKRTKGVFHWLWSRYSSKNKRCYKKAKACKKN
jgi:hypothetical protein